MIKEEFIQAKIPQQQADLKVFTTVFKFLNQKVEETEEAGQQDKLRAYKEVEQLFNSVHDKKITEDDFDVDEELNSTAFSKAGDVWLLGRHGVCCGDSTLPETYDTLMAGAKANMVLTDPPYNVNVEETAGKIKNDNMADEDFYKFLFAAFVNMEHAMEADASIYVFHADTEGLNFRKAFAAAGFSATAPARVLLPAT